MFRLEELGVAEMKKFVFTQHVQKMHKVYCSCDQHMTIMYKHLNLAGGGTIS